LAYKSTATTLPDRKTGISQHDGVTIQRNPDGSITGQGDGIAEAKSVITARIPKKNEFDENLAEDMGNHERRLLAMRLKEFAEVDKTSRKDWERREKAALEMMGIKDNVDPESDEQEDGHTVTHPALMEATCRFQANAIVELFPPTGPAETKILGTTTPAKTARAMRIRTFLNHYLTDVDEGYFNDTDKMCMYLPMGGSSFRRAAQDYTTGLPILRHVMATNFLAPYAGTDLKSMPRYAWKFTMTGEDIDRAMRIGMFLDIYLPQPAPPMPGMAMHAPSADQSDLRVSNMHERDRLYDMLEYHIDLELECDRQGAGNPKLKDDDTGIRPYIVVVDASNDQILMVRRNWRKADKDHKKRIWFAHHQFLPGLGFYGWGYPHVIGSLGMAASGAVNALLDSALAANFQGGFVSKEAKIAGEFRLEHGVWQQCDSTAEDLAKSFFTPPFKEPSPALFQLLDGLVNAAQRFTGTTDAAVGDGNNTGPVGTTVALIEQAQKPINAIHKRLHVSMSQELQMLCELIEDFMGESYDYEIGGDKQTLLKSDFAPGVGVVSVTDPAISSDTQRIMKGQAVLDLQQKDPSLYPAKKRAAAHRRFLVALKISNVDEIAPEVKTPLYLDPVAENANIFAGVPVQVFPQQDDQAHIAIHTDGMQRAAALYPPDVFQQTIQPAMQAHIRDHMAKAYYKQIYAAAGLQPRFDADGHPTGLTPQAEQQITAQVVSILGRLPHPKPKPGTPSAEQQQIQQELEFKAKAAQAAIDQKEQAFQAEEVRKQTAFDNEERRKDLALLNQEARIDIGTVTEGMRDAVTAKQTIVQAHAEHIQDLTHAAQSHEQQLEHGDEAHHLGLAHDMQSHDQDLEQGDEAHQQEIDQGSEQHAQTLEHGAESHDQTLEQGQEGHEADLERGQEQHEATIEQGEETTAAKIAAGDKIAKAAAGEEAEADSHMGKTGVK
jgi:hypothetical protein